MSLFLRLHEVSLAVRDFEGAQEQLSSLFQSEPTPVEETDEYGAMTRFGSVLVGGVRLSFMQDLEGTGPLGRFVAERGEGLYSVIVEVTDIRAAMAHMSGLGVRFVREEPMALEDTVYYGERFSRLELNWTHPKTTHGLVVEIQEFTR